MINTLTIHTCTYKSKQTKSMQDQSYAHVCNQIDRVEFKHKQTTQYNTHLHINSLTQCDGFYNQMSICRM